MEADAGIWEYRGRQRIHTHSAAMCWAGCHRLAAIASRLGLPDRAAYWNAVAEPMRHAAAEGAWNEQRGAFTAAFGSDDLDASVLLLPDLGVIEADDPRFVSTVTAMERELLRDSTLCVTRRGRFRPAGDGVPDLPFWLIDAWWSLGRREEARELFVDALAYRNRYGLLSEDIDPQTGTLWGNFPADLFHGGPDLDRDAPVAQLGGPLLARLVVVSNRVAVPSRDGQAGGLAVAVRALLKRPAASGSAGAEPFRPTATSPRGRSSTAICPMS